MTNTSAGRALVFNMSRTKVDKQTHGNFPAPLKILECVQEGLDNGMKVRKVVVEDKVGFADSLCERLDIRKNRRTLDRFV